MQHRKAQPGAPVTRGTFFLIVGPSGAGKDSLLRGARAALADDDAYVFVRRVITRPLAGEREDHEPLSVEEFRRRAQRGEFMLSWRVYDTEYGIPATYAEALADGRHVVANVSRQVVADAVSGFAPARVIQVTAPREVLQRRLAARADPATAAARLARAVVLPDGIAVTHLLNVADLESGTRRLVRLLTADRNE